MTDPALGTYLMLFCAGFVAGYCTGQLIATIRALRMIDDVIERQRRKDDNG